MKTLSQNKTRTGPSNILGYLLGCLLLLTALAVGVSPASADNFVRWQNASAGLDLGSGDGVTEITMGDDAVVAYTIVDGTGLYRTTDLGKKWDRLTGSAPPLRAPYAVQASPQDGRVVWAGCNDDGQGLWQSSDQGKTWRKVGDKQSGMASDDVEWIAVNPAFPNLLLVGHRGGPAMSVSTNAGKSWSASNLGAEVKRQMPFIVSESRWVVASRDHGGIRVTDDGGRTWIAAGDNTDYFPGPLPVIQAGEYLFSSKHHGTNKSTDGGKTWAYRMERHARVIGTMGDLLFREDRAEIRGEDARRLTIHLSGDYANSWEDVTGGLLDVVPERWQSQLVIQNQVDPYAHVRMATAWCAAAEKRTVLLALGKAGLYRGTLMQTTGGPLIVNPRVTPLTVLEGDTDTTLVVQAMIATRRGKLARAFVDLGAVGGGELDLFDDGEHEDGQVGDRLFGNSFRLAKKLPPGAKNLGIIAEDDSGRVSGVAATLKIASAEDRITVWDGDQFAQGHAWVGPAGGFNFFKSQSDEAHDGKVAMELHADVTGGWVGGGWNWHGWYPNNAGTDIRGYRNLSFWAKVDGESTRSFTVGLQCSTHQSDTATLDAADYVYPEGGNLLDGKWHEVVIPLADLYEKEDLKFDATKAWQLAISTWGPQAAKFSIYLDDVGFDNRNVRPHSQWVRLPERREPTPLGGQAIHVTANVDVRAEGHPISPFIYGAAMGDREAAREMGITALRAGGNPVTPVNWKKGFGSKGADWFYQNEGEETSPDRTWLARFFAENKKAELGTYLTIPMMGRVAKDGTSVAFDTRIYPDQDGSAGKAQPTDRLPHAGSGRQYVKGDDGKYRVDENKQWITRDITAVPDDTSVEMSPEEQTDFLKYMIDQMGYGPAKDGGIQYLALDNEPFLWHSTHRGMYSKGCSYDELWDRTRTYASLLKKIDPDVKIAGGNLWGWTAYFYSGLDSQLVGQGQGSWDNPPDFARHNQEPVARWLLKKLKQHEEETGTRLVDIFDFHFYPQTGIYMSGQPNDPQVMEGRVQETRVMWDPSWKDPSWMGKETGKVIQLIRLMKKWVDECNPGLQLAIGEYNFGGEKDVSGGVAQAELLGVFAREGLDHAYYWFFPAVNSSPYFAYKMFRNPDGAHTTFGDVYLPSKVSAPDDVSIHVARDTRTGRLTFILVSKRAARGAKVDLRLSQPLPSQSMRVFEYGLANKHCIGQWPDRTVQGNRLQIDLPPMTVLRFDLRPTSN